MRGLRRPVLLVARLLSVARLLPVARLLVVALGLLGFVAGPAGSGPQSWTSSTGTISGVRTWVMQHTSTRNRAAAKTRPGGQAQAATTVSTAAVRQVIAAAVPDEPPAPAALSGAGAEVRPPSPRVAAPPAAAFTAPGAVPEGVPRGRAPPPDARI